MKPSIPFTRLNKSPDAMRWFIVGAHEAGASESKIVSLTNLSRQTVWHVINCFKRTGTPNVRRRKRTKQRAKAMTMTDTEKSLPHYDARSEFHQDSSDSCSVDQYDLNCETNLDMDIKKEEQDEEHLAWKRALYFRRKGNSTATDTIDYVLYKGRKHEEKRISSWQKSQNQCKRYKRSQGDKGQYAVHPPSPPPHSNDLLLPKLEPTPTTLSPNSFRQLPYIQSINTFAIATDNTCHSTAITTSSPPSLPLSIKNTMQSLEESQALSLSSLISPSLSSSTASDTLLPPSSGFHHDCPVSQFKYWSRSDDKQLLHHVLTRMGCWDELDQQFKGRHSSLDCIKRWDLLQHYLFKELQQTGTLNW
ncbi:hypothetical protein BCR42DRAFT_404110 [Absidia repens]|uniref:Myb-like domain-containing protein n=1 Tax=Absidia repens TaxID=90262 RepID=A0A1X2IVR4_9FUNG|nr:hypothetical protein BCR42DRAFT_404110 [Absidia repens]